MKLALSWWRFNKSKDLTTNAPHENKMESLCVKGTLIPVLYRSHLTVPSCWRACEKQLADYCEKLRRLGREFCGQFGQAW
jgi:hypothetical protein